MRPIPARRHHWAVAIFILVVAANTLLTFLDPDAGDDQANMVAEVHKQAHPELFRHDGLLASDSPGAAWRARLPGWRAILAGAIAWGGQDEPLNGLRILGAAALAVYLVSAYALLYRQTHSTAVAALVAVISTAIFSTKRPYWGLGPVFAVTPSGLYLAAIPLLAIGFLNTHSRLRVAWVFLLAGACANVDLASGLNLAGVMLLATLAVGRLRPRAWGRAGASALAFLVGAFPALYYYWATFRAGEGFLPKVPFFQVREGLEQAGLNVLYPGVLVEALKWLPVAVVLAAPAGIILSRAGRFRVRDLAAWLWLLAGAWIVAFGVQGLVQLAAWKLSRAIPIVEPFEALRLAMLPLYALFAQGAVHLLRLAQTNRAWVRAGIALFAVAYYGSSYNTLALRHLATDAVATVARKERPPAAATAREELLAIARWAGRPENADALFIGPHPEIRLYARRSVLCCPADLPYLVHLAPSRLDEYLSCLRRQRELLTPGVGPAVEGDILAFAGRRGAAATYVVIPAGSAPPSSVRLPEVLPPLEEQAGTGWGGHWKVFRAVPPPATQPR